MIVNGIVEPMELAQLPYKSRTYEDYVGERGRKRLGKKKWRREVAAVIQMFKAALEPEYVAVGGGNARLLKQLPRGVRIGDNTNAFRLYYIPRHLKRFYHFLLIKLLSLFSSDYALIFNFYFLLTFPLTTISSLYVFRHFNISYLVAVLGSLLYSFLPYHFFRNQHHLVLAGYYIVPLMVMVLLWVFSGRLLAGGIDDLLKMAMIATRDIAGVAAEALQKRDFSGISTRELHGPRDISHDEAAAAIGAAIGKPKLSYRHFPAFLIEQGNAESHGIRARKNDEVEGLQGAEPVPQFMGIPHGFYLDGGQPNRDGSG